jgi:hypothetical protein
LAVGIFGIALLVVATIIHLVTQLGREKKSDKQDEPGNEAAEREVEDIQEGPEQEAKPALSI